MYSAHPYPYRKAIKGAKPCYINRMCAPLTNSTFEQLIIHLYTCIVIKCVTILLVIISDEANDLSEYSGSRSFTRYLRCGSKDIVIITVLTSASLFIYDGLQVRFFKSLFSVYTWIVKLIMPINVEHNHMHLILFQSYVGCPQMSSYRIFRVNASYL